MKLNKLLKVPNVSLNILRRKVKKKNKRVPKNIVAVDIGTFALKIVEMELGNAKEIKKVIYYPWPEPVANTDVLEIIKNPNFYKEIVYLLDSNNISCKDYYVLAASNRIVMRPIILPPNLPQSEIKQLLSLQIVDQIPYNEDEVYYDYSIIKRDDQETVIHVFASERGYIDEIVGLFTALKKKIHCINVAPVVIYNAVVNNYQLQLSNTEIFVTINIGATATELSIFKNTELLLFRTIPIGGNRFTTAFGQDKDSTLQEAEYNKCEYGLHKAVEMQTVLGTQNELFEHLWRSIQYVISRNKSYTLKKVFLSGGSAHLKGFSHKFSRYMEIQMHIPGGKRAFEVIVLNPFEGLQLARDIDISCFQEVAASFASVIGLAHGGV